MGAAARTKENGQETLSGKAKLIFAGLVLAIIGSVISGSYAKATLTNYTGFGMLLTGIAVFVFGTCATATATVETRFSQDKPANIRANKPKTLCLSIWAIGIGSMLLLTGSLIARSSKNTLMNYSGFGTLLAGTGIFVYGVFETARFSTLGYLNGKWICTAQQKEELPNRIKNFWKNSENKRHPKPRRRNGCPVLAFLQSLELNLLVSGPVWWSSLPQGQGMGRSHPNGAYSNNYFQCFLWKTTIGQAYDTFFMLIFISFIVLFASAFFWPRD